MPSMRITTKALQSYRSEAVRSGKPQLLWDTEIRGFGVKVRPSGTCSLLVQKAIGGREGKDRRITFGQYPAMSLEAARKEAGRIASDVYAGVDVLEHRRRQKRQIKEKLDTELESVLTHYLHRRAEPNNRYWRETERLLTRLAVAEFGRRTPVSSITKNDVRRLIEAKEDSHPGAARTLFAALRPFFKWCVERDLLALSPMEGLSPPAVTAARDRILSDEEVRIFWQATDSLGYPFGPFYQLLLLTAQRREEVAAIAWPEIDLAKGEWLIPKYRTKNGKAHLVHLSPQAVAILESCPRINEFVFTTNGVTSISGYSKAKLRLDAQCASLNEKPPQGFSKQNFATEWRVHDLRRTAASGMASLGFQPHIVERVLNHISGAQGGLVGVYQRFEYVEDRRRALFAWAKKVCGGDDRQVLHFPKKGSTTA